MGWEEPALRSGGRRGTGSEDLVHTLVLSPSKDERFCSWFDKRVLSETYILDKLRMSEESKGSSRAVMYRFVARPAGGGAKQHSH